MKVHYNISNPLLSLFKAPEKANKNTNAPTRCIMYDTACMIKCFVCFVCFMIKCFVCLYDKMFCSVLLQYYGITTRFFIRTTL